MSTQLPHIIRQRLIVEGAPQDQNDAVRRGELEAGIEAAGAQLHWDHPSTPMVSSASAGSATQPVRGDHTHLNPVIHGTADLEVGVSSLPEGHVYLSTAGNDLKLYKGDGNGVAQLFHELIAPRKMREAGSTDVVKVFASADALFLLTTDGAVYSCGANTYGQLGHVNTATATSSNLAEVPGLPGIAEIVPRGGSTYFLTQQGTVYSCGDNCSGQLGRIAESGSQTISNVGEIPGLTDIVEIVATGGAGTVSGAFFRTSTGKVYSCGYNGYDYVTHNIGHTVMTGSPTVSNLTEIPGLPPVQRICVSGLSTLFLTTTGKVYSCGDNEYGQLGREPEYSMHYNFALGEIPGLSGVTVVKVIVDSSNSYFITAGGDVYNCGLNGWGQLGDTRPNGGYDLTGYTYYASFCNFGKLTAIPEPVADIVCSGYSTFYITRSGKVYSCGCNSSGQLGRAVPDIEEATVYNAELDIYVPGISAANIGEIVGLPPIAEVMSVGGTTTGSTYFLTKTGIVFSCGYNDVGQLGRLAANGSAAVSNLDSIPDLGGVTYMSGVFFRTSDGTCHSRGDNTYGRLGRVTASGSPAAPNLGPTPLAGIEQVVRTGNSTYFVTADKKAYSCGYNNVGQLGRAIANGSATKSNLGAITLI